MAALWWRQSVTWIWPAITRVGQAREEKREKAVLKVTEVVEVNKVHKVQEVLRWVGWHVFAESEIFKMHDFIFVSGLSRILGGPNFISLLGGKRMRCWP